MDNLKNIAAFLNKLFYAAKNNLYPSHTTQQKLFTCCKNRANKYFLKHIQFALVCFLCLCFLNNVSAQTIIKGRVTDSKKKPVETAGIYFKGTTEGTLADSAGNFILSTNLKGEQTLK